MFSDKVPAKGFPLAKGFVVDFTKEFYGATTVTLTAQDPVGGQTIYLNGNAKLQLKASNFKGQGMSIVASTSSSKKSFGKRSIEGECNF